MELHLPGRRGHASPEDTDSQIGITPDLGHGERQDVLRESAAESITADPAGWAAHRVRELADSYLQPHNTVHYGGRSVKDALVDWLKDDRSAGGLVDLTRLESFWPKLALYVFHFTGLLLGAAGMIQTARRWRALLPLYAVAIYFTGIHLVLLALPRYIFPTYPCSGCSAQRSSSGRRRPAARASRAGLTLHRFQAGR